MVKQSDKSEQIKMFFIAIEQLIITSNRLLLRIAHDSVQYTYPLTYTIPYIVFYKIIIWLPYNNMIFRINIDTMSNIDVLFG